MQINSKVSTEITLNQGEIEEALVDYVKARTTFSADAKFKIEFEDAIEGNDLVAIINVNSTVQEPETPKAPPKTRGARSNAGADKTHGASGGTGDKPAISETPEDRQDPDNPDGLKTEVVNDPPFDADPPKGDEFLQGILEKGKAKEGSKSAEELTPPKIFADKTNSAPPKPAEPEVDPTVKAKSLFANLSKPTN